MKSILFLSMVALTSANVLGRQQFQKNEFNTEDVIAKAFEAYMPDFLSSVSAASRSEFIKIYSNSTVPRSQIETQLNQWAVQNGVQIQWNAFVTEAKAKKEDIIQNLREIFNRLPGVFENVVQVDNNMNLSQQEAVSQTMNAFNSIQPYIENIKTSISDIFKQFTSKGNSQGGNNYTILPDFNGGFQGGNNGFQGGNGGSQGGNNGFQGGNNGFQGGNNGFQGGNGGFQGGNTGSQGGNGGFQNGNGGFQNGNGGFQNGNGGSQNGNNGFQGGNGGFQGGNGGFQNGNGGSQNGNNGFQGGNGEFQSGRSGFQNGNMGSQGGNNGFQGGNNGFQTRNNGNFGSPDGNNVWSTNNQQGLQGSNNGQQNSNGFLPTNQIQGQQSNGFVNTLEFHPRQPGQF